MQKAQHHCLHSAIRVPVCILLYRSMKIELIGLNQLNCAGSREEMSSEDEGETAAPFDLLERAERGLAAAPDSDDGCVCTDI